MPALPPLVPYLHGAAGGRGLQGVAHQVRQHPVQQRRIAGEGLVRPLLDHQPASRGHLLDGEGDPQLGQDLGGPHRPALHPGPAVAGAEEPALAADLLQQLAGQVADLVDGGGRVVGRIPEPAGGPRQPPGQVEQVMQEHLVQGLPPLLPGDILEDEQLQVLAGPGQRHAAHPERPGPAESVLDRGARGVLAGVQRPQAFGRREGEGLQGAAGGRHQPPVPVQDQRVPADRLQDRRHRRIVQQPSGLPDRLPGARTPSNGGSGGSIRPPFSHGNLSRSEDVGKYMN